MTQTTQHGERQPMVRRYNYTDRTVIAADFGGAADDISVDIVGDTAIVVVDDRDGGVEHELTLPDGEASAFIRNGVVTLDVER